MGKVYLNQNSLRLKVDTSVDITGATTRLIKYKKPDGTAGQFIATEEAPATAGVIYYDFVSTELDQEGPWTMWSYVTFSDARSAPGEPFKVIVYVEGE